MVSSRIKKRFRSRIAPAARSAHRVGLSPNAVSVLGGLLAIAAGILYALRGRNSLFILAGGILLLLSGFCDALDGALAETYGTGSPWGGFLDSLTDRYADAFVVSGVTVGGLCDQYVGLIALVGTLLVSYVRARAEVMGIGMEGVGLAERPERILLIAAASLAFYLDTRAIWFGMLLLAVITHLTVAQRVWHVYRSRPT